MTISSAAGLRPLPVPPHYMRAAEQQQVREMTGATGRLAGDHRSSDQITEQPPVLKNFLDTRDHYEVSDDLKRQVGDWSAANQDPDSRADATYNLDKVLRFIDNVDDLKLSASHSRNGVLEGFSNHGYTIHPDSEASLLKAFSLRGYEALRGA